MFSGCVKIRIEKKRCSILKEPMTDENDFNLFKNIFAPDIADLVMSSMTAVQDDLTGQKQWECNQCLYRKKYKSHVVKHIERVHVKVTMSCPYCDLVCATREKLKSHLKFQH